jgi:poly(A) polymerase
MEPADDLPLRDGPSAGDGPPGEGSPEPRVVSGRGRVRRETLDPDAVHVVSRLQRMGHAAYLVGGCVRDLLLGLEPKDFDVATDATPNRIRRVFRNAWIIGRRFRLAHVRFPDGKVVETATFRADPGERGTHPEGDDRPIFWDNAFGTAAEDARRRDFTVNALFYDPFRDEVLDYVGGLEDVERRVIRTIGDPARRMREDPVRMVRAAHFAARMGGEVESSLLAAIRENASEIEKASPARLYVELLKVLTRGSARPTIWTLHEVGVLEHWLPELCAGLEEPIEWPQSGGGTHEAASRGEPEDVPAAHLTWNMLGAADAWGVAVHGAPDALALASLFGPWLLESYRKAPRAHDLPTHLEEEFRPLAVRMSVPRRVSGELRDALAMLDRLRHPPENRSRLHAMLRRPAFFAALDYFGLDLRARDHDLAPLDAWRALVAERRAGEERRRRARAAGAAEEGAAPAAAPVEDGEPPFRRRRRGRRRSADALSPTTSPLADGRGAEPEARAPRPPPPPPARPTPPSEPPAPPKPPRRPFGEGLV